MTMAKTPRPSETTPSQEVGVGVVPVPEGRVFGAVGVPEPAAGAEIVVVLAVPGEASSFEVMRWCNSVGAVAFPRVGSVTLRAGSAAAREAAPRAPPGRSGAREAAPERTP
jgi:hypothetical protein